MAPNIIFPPRDQEYLLPPSLKDWVPADHFVWFLLDAVKCMNLQAFYIGVRLDGSGGALYQPEMMATLLIYSYAKGVRSSRAIEKLCQSDLAYRVICGNLIPDHSSIARFRQTHEKAFASLFCEALGLCREAGFTSVGAIAVDGTKMQGNASLAASLTKETLYEQVEKIIREAKEKDAAEDRSFGAKRGDEIPPELLEPGSRLDRIKKCLRTIEEREKLEQTKEEEKLQQRQEKEAKAGKPLRGRKPKEGKASKAHKANTTDPESRTLKTAKSYIQGYNAQAVANSEQIILAAEVYQDANDQHLLHPMLEKTVENLQAIGETNMPKVALADAGYSNEPALVKAAPAGMEIIASLPVAPILSYRCGSTSVRAGS
jgi:transposase